VGAATLFVITAIGEATSPEFTSETKNALALLRFPAYYTFGFVSVIVALVSGVFAGRRSAQGRGRMRVYLLLLVVVLVVMIADYVAVYRPLAVMIATPDARPASFQTYHKASMYINAVHVGLSGLAAFMICWPGLQMHEVTSGDE
jgi:hypothetical protein